MQISLRNLRKHDCARKPVPAFPHPALAPAAGASWDKRAERRWRTHLRSGKIVDGRAHIVTESQVRDRSARGARLRLAANVLLPRHIRFFDEIATRMFEATVVWQRGRDIGMTLLREIDPRSLTRAELFRLGIKIRSADH